MNILIIEDEKPAADILSRHIHKLDKNIEIAAVLESVEQSVNWLSATPTPDLIFMDIQLDDSLCFEIFETLKVDTPIIFTTAYDKYAIDAFKVNSVDYLLKPVEEKLLANALEKFKSLHWNKIQPDFNELFKNYTHKYKTRFLVKIGMRYKSISTTDVRIFHINERSTFLRTTGSKDYGLDYSLDQLQNLVDSDNFFRINRNCLVNIDSIIEILSYSSSRLQLSLSSENQSELFVVSRDRVSQFKKWMDR